MDYYNFLFTLWIFLCNQNPKDEILVLLNHCIFFMNIYIYIYVYIYIYIYEIHFIIYRSGVSLHSSQSQGSRFISLSSKSLRKPSMHR